MTLEELMARHALRPIRGCPGRFVVVDPALDRMPPEQAFGLEVREHAVAGARDLVLVAPLPGGGGLISYARPEGTYCHTIADAAGFARKLAQLGVAASTASSHARDRGQ